MQANKTWGAKRWLHVMAALTVSTLALSSCGSAEGDARSDGDTQLKVQLSWLTGSQNLGEQVAYLEGYYEDEGLDVELIPGGPDADQVQAVASGSIDVGVVSSSPRIMLAVGEGLPVRAFASGVQEHPLAFVSKSENPVHEPADLAGKTVGLQSTAGPFLDAMLAQAGLTRDDVSVVPVGGDVQPLVGGQVDTLTAWRTNEVALEPLGEGVVEMPLWDQGLQMYANVYVAQPRMLDQDAEVLEAFVRATARGWLDVREDPEGTLARVVEENPSLDLAAEQASLEAFLPYVFTDATETDGWGQMSETVWANQMGVWTDLGQFPGDTPDASDVFTNDVLAATTEARTVS